eukprot:362189-Chlamydomonas_euryale.AAC.3
MFSPQTCIVSYHPALSLAGQFWRCILGYGIKFALLWALPPPMFTPVSGWPPDWILLRGAALSIKRACLWCAFGAARSSLSASV